MIRSADMPLVATYWPPGIPDGSGSYDYSTITPIEVACRWQDTATLYRDAAGREKRAAHVVYINYEVKVDGYLALGSPNDLDLSKSVQEIEGARIILSVNSTTSIDGSETLIKVLM